LCLRQIGFQKSREILKQHRDKVERLAQALVERMELTEAEIDALLSELHLSSSGCTQMQKLG
jgi:ATP-dependent Zn protease